MMVAQSWGQVLQIERCYVARPDPVVRAARALAEASAAILSGRVVGVQDGETITVLDANRQQHKSHLSGIDAPELKQAFRARYKQTISALVLNKSAEQI